MRNFMFILAAISWVLAGAMFFLALQEPNSDLKWYSLFVFMSGIILFLFGIIERIKKDFERAFGFDKYPHEIRDQEGNVITRTVEFDPKMN